MTLERRRTDQHCESCGAVMHLRLTNGVHADEPSQSRRLPLHYVCPDCGHETGLISPREGLRSVRFWPS